MALRDETEKVRIAAATGLGKFADPRAIKLLVQALKDKKPQVRKTAARSLYWIGGDHSVDALIMALEDASPIVRRTAAKSLGNLGNILAIDVLIRSLSDDDPEVRHTASLALKELGEPLGLLIYASMQGNEEALIELIREKDHRAAIPMIIALNSKDYRIQRTAARYLGETGNIRVLKDLVKMAAGFRLLDRFNGMAVLSELNINSIFKLFYSGFKILFSAWTILYFLLIIFLISIIMFKSSSWPTKQSILFGVVLGSLIFGVLFSLPALSFSLNYLVYFTIGLLPFSVAILIYGLLNHRFNYRTTSIDR